MNEATDEGSVHWTEVLQAQRDERDRSRERRGREYVNYELRNLAVAYSWGGEDVLLCVSPDPR